MTHFPTVCPTVDMPLPNAASRHPFHPKPKATLPPPHNPSPPSGKGYIEQADFYKAMFNLADIWVDTIRVKDYVRFLRSCYVVLRRSNWAKYARALPADSRSRDDSSSCTRSLRSLAPSITTTPPLTPTSTWLNNMSFDEFLQPSGNTPVPLQTALHCPTLPYTRLCLQGIGA